MMNTLQELVAKKLNLKYAYIKVMNTNFIEIEYWDTFRYILWTNPLKSTN